MTIKLHCFGESGNAYKAALALELAGLEWEVVKVDFFNGGSRTDADRELDVGTLDLRERERRLDETVAGRV